MSRAAPIYEGGTNLWHQFEAEDAVEAKGAFGLTLEAIGS